jgi:hypothetical protein
MSNQNIESLYENIEAADLALCKEFAKYTLTERNDYTVEFNEKISKYLNGAPEALYIAMMRYIDLSEYKHDPEYDDDFDKAQKTANKLLIQITFAGLIAQRAEASLELAKFRKEEIELAKLREEESSYTSPNLIRQLYDLEASQIKVYGLTGSTEKANTARKAFNLVTKITNIFEGEYIKTGTGPLVEMAHHRKLTLAA